MLRQLILIAIFATATAFVASKIIIENNGTNIEKVKQRFEIKKRTAIGCSPDWVAINALTEETEIPIIPGTGNYTWTITTKSDSANMYFNQGIIMYYSFFVLHVYSYITHM